VKPAPNRKRYRHAQSDPRVSDRSCGLLRARRHPPIPTRPKAPPGPTASVEKDQACITVSLAKATYEFHEPIVFTVALKNLSDRFVRFAEPDENWTILFAVKQISGAEAMPNPRHGDSFGPPANFGWDFFSSEEKRYDFEANWRYSGRLPVGHYELLVTYYAPKDVKNIWRGKAVLGPIGFTVVGVTDEAEARGEAFWALLRNYVSSGSNDPIVARLSEMAITSTGGVYAELAGYVEAWYLYRSKDKEGYYRAIRKYIVDHPKVPYYSETARRGLAWRLYDDKRYDEALSVLEDCAEGWQRSDLRKRIELKKQKQN